MNNSEKLSLFRKSSDVSRGLTDIPIKNDYILSKKLMLNKEVINSLNRVSQDIYVAAGTLSCVSACVCPSQLPKWCDPASNPGQHSCLPNPCPPRVYE